MVLHRRTHGGAGCRRPGLLGLGSLVGTTWVPGAVFYVIAGLGVTAGFHRYFTHRAYKAKRWLEMTLAVAACSSSPCRPSAGSPSTAGTTSSAMRRTIPIRPGGSATPSGPEQGATFGHAKIAGRALLRKGLSPLITTLSVPQAAPVIAEAWLRSGNTGSGRGAARQVKQAVTTTRGCGVSGTIMLRGDSAFGTKKVIAACLDEQIEFSVTLSRNKRVTKAIDSIEETE